MTDNKESLSVCGCCALPEGPNPESITNRPGLSVLAYRVGTHGQFKAAMKNAISKDRALDGLTVRDDDDFSIALLDAWAVTADVLSFYQERIANEGYLRTATERLSLLHLARLVGYRLNPGVAADTYLAFTIEKGTGSSEPSPPPVTIETGTKAQSVPGPDEKAQTFETVEEIEARAEWNAITPRMTRPQVVESDMSGILLDGTSTNLKAGDMVMILAGSNPILKKIVKVTPDNDAKTTQIDLESTGVSSTTPIDDSGVFVFRQRSFPFGYNALKMPVYEPATGKPKDPVVWQEWTTNENKGSVYLDNAYDEIIPGSYLAIRKGDGSIYVYGVESVNVCTRSDYGISSRTTLLSIPSNSDWWDTTATGLGIRGITLYTRSERQTLVEVPIDDAVEGDSITLDSVYTGLKKGQTVILTGELSDQEGVYASEMRTLSEVIDEIIDNEDFTVITLDKALTYTYLRDTVTINANVAHATHGETVTEILGSGDASRIFQQFTLQQTPLTYISASSAGGAETTLEVRVNKLLWEEVDSFYGHGPDERIYITRLDNSGKTYVQFGDGVTGSRLPTGQQNVSAAYRKGIGLDGLLDAGQLTNLMTRPLGVKECVNPLAPTGAADPETVDQARQNTPLTVLTLDRIVSLKDYEDFSNAFAGIDKARADWVWSGEIRQVCITVAGADGQEVTKDSDLYNNLVKAIENYSDGLQSFCVKSYASCSFYIKASIRVYTEYVAETVIEEVKTTLEEGFSFENRQLARPVTKSEVMAVIQGVDGVEAVDLDELYLDGEENLLNSYLKAGRGQWDSDQGEAVPAELLTLTPNRADISLMEVES